jgi:hypothetical protein
MERRYYEVIIDTTEVPSRHRRLHVITFDNENPVDRAVREGLLDPRFKPHVRCRELSREECHQRWQSLKAA